MSKKISDEKFDAFLADIFAQAAPDEQDVNDIADSPAIWWGVQRQIANQKTASAWPPVTKFWQVLKFGVPAFAALGLLVAFIALRTPVQPLENAGIRPVDSVQTPEAVTMPKLSETSAATIDSPIVNAASTRRAATKRTVTPTTAVRRTVIRSKTPTVGKDEIKTGFIALSYARDAESGQIVRVKVPSAMMVTLGLVSTVEKPSVLVDAEVIVGDDGLTRAIRFIR